jgi:hypothetical protein
MREKLEKKEQEKVAKKGKGKARIKLLQVKKHLLLLKIWMLKVRIVMRRNMIVLRWIVKVPSTYSFCLKISKCYLLLLINYPTTL